MGKVRNSSFNQSTKMKSTFLKENSCASENDGAFLLTSGAPRKLNDSLTMPTHRTIKGAKRVSPSPKRWQPGMQAAESLSPYEMRNNNIGSMLTPGFQNKYEP